MCNVLVRRSDGDSEDGEATYTGPDEGCAEVAEGCAEVAEGCAEPEDCADEDAAQEDALAADVG